jgi:UDP-glucose 4-epimerase
MRALVTGGAGFIGSRLHALLLDAGHEVLVLDDLRLDHPKPATHNRLRVLVESIGTEAAAESVRDFAPELVFHLAAIHYIPYTEAHPEETRQVNVEGTRWLLDQLELLAGRGRPPRAVVACSSASVYGFSDTPLREDSPYAPRGVYGETKVATEALLRSYAADHADQRVAAARLFNVYGPGDRNPHLMPALMEQIRRGETIKVGNTWPLRDYVHVDDVAHALAELAAGAPGHVVYNVGTGRGTSVRRLIEVLADVAGLPATFEVDQSRVRADDGHLVGDPARLVADTGWRPRVELADGLAWLVADEGERPGEHGRVSGE